MSVNKVILIGNVGMPPQVKHFDNGGVVAQFSIATTDRAFKTKDGREIPEKTEWHNVVMQNRLAEVAEKYVKKGDRLYIEGKLRTRKYTDTQNAERYITEIIGYEMEILSPKKEGQTAPPPEAVPTPNSVTQTVEEKTDDLPF